MRAAVVADALNATQVLGMLSKPHTQHGKLATQCLDLRTVVPIRILARLAQPAAECERCPKGKNKITTFWTCYGFSLRKVVYGG